MKRREIRLTLCYKPWRQGLAFASDLQAWSYDMQCSRRSLIRQVDGWSCQGFDGFAAVEIASVLGKNCRESRGPYFQKSVSERIYSNRQNCGHITYFDAIQQSLFVPSAATSIAKSLILYAVCHRPAGRNVHEHCPVIRPRMSRKCCVEGGRSGRSAKVDPRKVRLRRSKTSASMAVTAAAQPR